MTAQEESQIEAAVIEQLERTGVPYEVIEIDPAYADTAQFCQRYGYPPGNSGNTIIVASKREPKQYAACVVRADQRLDVNHRVRQLMGVRRLSFASAEETVELTGQMIGGVTALALPEGLPLYVDDGLMGLEYVILGGGSRSRKVSVSPEVFRQLPGAEIVPGLVIGG